MSCRRLCSHHLKASGLAMRSCLRPSQAAAPLAVQSNTVPTRHGHGAACKALQQRRSGDNGRGRHDGRQDSRRRWTSGLLMAAGPIVLIEFKSEGDEKDAEQSQVRPLSAVELKHVLRQADQLHAECEYTEEYELLLPHYPGGGADVMWRLARVSVLCRDVSFPMGPHYQGCTRQALRLASKARNLAPDNAMCQLWFGITLNHMQPNRSSQQKLTDVGLMHEAFTECLRLNPKLAYAWYSLGQWHYHVAKAGWMTWKAIEFSNPGLKPGTFEDALECFLRAEEVSPGFYLDNLNYMVWSYEQLKQPEKVIEVLQKLVRYEPENDVDVDNIHAATIKLQGLTGKAK